MAGLSHVRGNYQKELEEKYHIFAMDPRYETKAEEDISGKIKTSLEESQDSFHYAVGNTILSKKYIWQIRAEKH